jgi:hypothetical protein
MDDAHPSELLGAASSSTKSKAKLRGAGIEHRATTILFSLKSFSCFTFKVIPKEWC